MDKIVFPTANGVVVTCEDKQVVSVIDIKGQKKLKSFRNKNKVIFWHFPFFRGVQHIFCGMFALLQALILTYDLCYPPVKTKDINKFYKMKLLLLMLVAIFGVVVSALALGLLPGKLG